MSVCEIIGLSVVAEKEKENVEHSAWIGCQRTGYSLRRLSNIVSKGAIFLYLRVGYEIIEQVYQVWLAKIQILALRFISGKLGKSHC
jgi:hypothetical protein